MEAQLNLCL